MQVTQLGPDCATIESWKNLRFHFFSAGELERLRSAKFEQLKIRTDEPRVREIYHGVVAALQKSDTHRNNASIGAYYSDGKPVTEAIQFRGHEQEGVSVPSTSRPAKGAAAKDGRCAYYLGIDASRYGHFILETLCRAWAWEKYNECEVAVIQSPPVPDFARSLLNAVPRLAERVETLTGPVQFERLIVPEPTFVMGRQAHLRFKLLCEELAQRALHNREPAQTDQPLYLSRAGLAAPVKRALVGEARLERFLEGEGFRVVRPETLPIGSQIALFNQHRWILAPIGSACHTRLFSRIPVNMITMTGDRVKHSYPLVDLLCRGETRYANLFSVPAWKEPVPAHSAQPVVLEDERLLVLLKSLGLLRSKAAFAEPPPSMTAYISQWIQFASNKRRRPFSEAVERLSAYGAGNR